ncbi:pro-FMRFamide-related neuropeptide VF [Gastrophryne carolinensis]
MLLSLWVIFFAFSTCSSETSMTNLESQEKYDDLYESREDFQRNIDSNEYQYWGSNSLNDLNKYSMLPMQPEQSIHQERSLKPANLPLRFGRASDDKAAKSVPNIPLRFGRYISGKANIQSAANLPQRFGRSQYHGHFILSIPTLPVQKLAMAFDYELNSQM